MMKLINFLREGYKNENITQAFWLLVSTVVGLVLGFVTNSLLTRILGKDVYGDYALLFNIYSFCQIIFNFGIFYTISRLVAITNDTSRARGYYLVGSFFVVILFIVMAISVIGYAFFSENIDKGSLFKVLLISIPFSWVYLLTTLNENFLPGDNKINLLSWSRLLPKIFLTIILAIIFFYFKKIDLISIVLLNYLTFIIAYVYVFIKVKPTFKQFRRRLSEVLVGNKQFGFDIYFGALIASGSSSLSGILISHFGVNNVEVGYYTLATLLASPLSMIPNIIATTQFKNFAQSLFIPPKMILLTFGLSTFLMLFIIFAARPIVSVFFGKEYLDSIVMLQYLSIGFVFYGIGDFFNRFLLAKGKGKELRNASFLVGFTLLIANILFIYLYGGEGAAFARILSGLMYALVILYYYKKEIKGL
ncbi:oligosaccharide flippase family protein [Chryseobacterium sp. BIGb0232]|uniref:oligosaccharide flippase family protein n=1 Tax=Chryseobacterium sp. BIGb0232 TaxID=2940598 RepID=UPI000F45F1EC|nr:oligosaccharide flippase family protein [Chryseobacterium sp. BIGb0232]MCS4301644.1 O-antigen/teichoic acid export membrane protein [Chryseobacterium sp. BIGb0232]ROS19502.1 O-antigen/teichoic acid export membrane protein [Chryseobacterium nakagawai]